MNNSLIHPQNSNQNVFVSGYEIERLLADDSKTEFFDQLPNDSQSESSRDNIDAASNNSNGETSGAEGKNIQRLREFQAEIWNNQ